MVDEKRETDHEKLSRLEHESSEWYEHNRGAGFYFSECPDWIRQHNREIEIDRIRRKYSDNHDDYGGHFCGH